MASMLMRRAQGRLLLAMLLGTILALSGCGGTNTPAVCSDADALKSSTSALADVKLEKGALPELKSKLATVKKDFNQLKSHAKSQFSSQTKAVDSAATAFKASLDAAIAQPSASTVSAAGAALKSLKVAVTDLGSAVKKTC